MSRPKRDLYQQFADEMGEVVRTKYPHVCFFSYGSFARKTHDARKGSDIDGGFVFPGGVLLPQNELLSLGDDLARVHDRNRVKLQFNLLDTVSSADGRFLSFTDDYVNDIHANGIVLSGPDLRDHLRGLQYKHSALNSAAFDVRKVRNFLLFADDHYRIDPELFARKAHSVVSAAVKFPKKIVQLQTAALLTNAGEAHAQAGQLLGCDMSDFAQLERMTTISEEQIAANYRLGIALYCGAATAVERLVGAYITKFPEISEREARCNIPRLSRLEKS
jgi:hypothetical protein